MLGNNEANIKAVITADDRASSVLKNFGDHVNGVGGKIANGLEIAAKSLAVAGTAAVAFGALSVKAFTESEDLIAQTNAVLKSTGQIAGVTADQVTKLATALQKTTKFSDEEVRSAENLLLTFTSIGKDIFPQATATVLDMATALGEDTKSASIQLGKALQDPILGITALRRVGVNFSDAQKDVIQGLVDTGQKAEAQKLILKELQTEFGGSAVAAGSTFSGSLIKLKNALNDVQETIGQVIVTKLAPFVTKALEAVAAIDWNAVIGRTIAALQQLGVTLANTYTTVSNYLTPGLMRMRDIIVEVWQVIVSMFGPSLDALWNTISTRLLPQIKELWNAIEPGFTGALKVLAVVAGVIVTGAIWVLINALNVIISVVGFGIRMFNDLAKAVGNFIGFAINSAGSIAGVFKAEFNGIARAWNATVGKISLHAPDWVPGMGGKGFDVPDIPYLAEGGIVTRPTLAVIGEAGPEAVVPLNKGGRMGSPINITIQAGAFMGSDIEARKFAQTVLNHLRDVAGSKNMTLNELMGA